MPEENGSEIKGMEFARLALYVGVGVLGLLALAIGIIQKDWELVGLGAAIMSACGIAAWNVPGVNDSIKGRGRYGA